jgi:hypothetical protein
MGIYHQDHMQIATLKKMQKCINNEYSTMLLRKSFESEIVRAQSHDTPLAVRWNLVRSIPGSRDGRGG